MKVQQGLLGAGMNIKKYLDTILNQIKSSVNSDATKTTKIANIINRFSGGFNNCFQALDLVQMGALCVMSSNKATTSSTPITGGISINANQAVYKKLTDCLSTYDVLCLVTTGQSISEDLVLDNDLFKKKSAQYGSACATLKAKYNCTSNCLDYEKVFIEQIPPLSYDFFPVGTFWDTMTSNFNTILNNVQNWFKNTFSRRLVGTNNP